MRKLGMLLMLSCALVFTHCDSSEKDIPNQNTSNKTDRQNHIDWQKRQVQLDNLTNLIAGNTYLAVYSEIYARKESRTYPLTITVSLRNTSLQDTVYVSKSEYYNTHGELINTYFDKPIYIAPMETVEIVVEEDHEQGGSGGNFVFHWASKTAKTKPLFEAIMISASGQQGISFTTQGIDLDKN